MSLISNSIRRRAHNGPRNMAAICLVHKEEHGPRPILTGLQGPERQNALHAQREWDAALMRRSPIIAQSINNDRVRIDNTGMVVPK